MLKAAGVLMVVSDVVAVVAMLVGVLMIFSGLEDLAEQLSPVLFAIVAFSMSTRILAGVRAATDPGLQGQKRMDAVTRYLFFPGWSASRYLRRSK